MGKTRSYTIICGCSRQREFPMVMDVEEKASTTSESPSIQVDCPFSHAAQCIKKLTVPLPAGDQPVVDSYVLRSH